MLFFKKNTKLDGAKKEGRQLRKPMTHFKVVILSMGVLILLGVLASGTLAVSNTPNFCGVCHEMTPEYATWEVSTHNKVSCVACHIPPGVINLVKHKLASIKELTVHISGNLPQPIAMNEVISNEVCEQCHTLLRRISPSGDLIMPHDKHLAQGIACIACHNGVAHGFIAERGLTDKKNYGTWTVSKAEKAMTLSSTKTSMNVCMDCHIKANNDEKPWYTHDGVEKTEEQRIAASEHKPDIASPATIAAKLASPVNVPSPSKSTLKPPTIECNGCHSKMPIPNTHKDDTWTINHGITAGKGIFECAQCHSHPNERALVAKDTDVVDYVRSNVFCVTCHIKRPVMHMDNKKDWRTGHQTSLKEKGMDSCLTCHDIDTNVTHKQLSLGDAQVVNLLSANSIYCNQCHLFSGKDDIPK